MKQTIKLQSLLITSIIVIIYAIGIAGISYFGFLTNLYWQIGFGIFIALIVYILNYFVFLKKIEKKNFTVHNVTLPNRLLRKDFDLATTGKNMPEDGIKNEENQADEIKKLKEMEQYRKDFLGNVSHELKTPIFNIQGYILTLLDGGIDDKKINKLYLQRAERSINRMITIVDDLVSISRLESGEFKLQIEEFNLVKLIEDVFETHEMMARNFKVKLDFDKKYTKPIKVLADRKRIMEVLNNLIVNSIKYGKVNGKTKVSIAQSGENILVDITDNGIGIDEEDLPRIFERFYRVDKSRSRESGGTGLGLAIVKHIIQAHNQSINVRSGMNRGTSFIFSLRKS